MKPSSHHRPPAAATRLRLPGGTMSAVTMLVVGALLLVALRPDPARPEGSAAQPAPLLPPRGTATAGHSAFRQGGQSIEPASGDSTPTGDNASQIDGAPPIGDDTAGATGLPALPGPWLAEEHQPAPPATARTVASAQDVEALRYRVETLLARDPEALEQARALLAERDPQALARNLELLADSFGLD